jgi:predicted transcriptional regulator
VTEDDSLSTKTIWLLILSNGGRWGVGEIAQELGSTSEKVCNFIGMMAARGFVKRYPRSEGRKRHEYAVDGSCRIPMAVTMKEIMEAQS